MNVKEIIREAGYKIAKGVGSEWEFFVSDGKLAVTCYEMPNGDFKAYSSDEESKGHHTDSENCILTVLKKTFEEEQKFLANGGESLCEYQFQHSEWK